VVSHCAAAAAASSQYASVFGGSSRNSNASSFCVLCANVMQVSRCCVTIVLHGFAAAAGAGSSLHWCYSSR
jgi:hypothetical protein